MHLHAAGIDVGATEHWVAVPEDRDAQPVQRCGMCTADLYAWAAGLRQGQSDPVGLESTGVSGLARFAVLAARGCDVTLVEAQQARQVPGRKPDVQDGHWLPELHTSGGLRGACRPEDEVWVLRSSWRQRRRLVAMASRAVHHRQKALAQMHRKRTEVVSAITGKTGMTIIRAILAGARAPQRWATSRAKRGTYDHATIAQALTGHWRAEPLLAWQHAVDQDDVLAQQLRAGEGHLDGWLQAFVPDVETAAPQAPPARPWRASRSNPLRGEGQASRAAMTGVALPQSDGIASLTALQGLRESDLAMTRWPTRQPCAAWLG